jgi:hypothetical protein
MSLKIELEAKINELSDEREIHRYLKQYPELIRSTFMPYGGMLEYVIPEFALRLYRTDFIVAQSYSGGWDVALIELEPVGEKLFNQSGTPARRLNGALKQIRDWQSYIRAEKPSFCAALADVAMRNDTLLPDEIRGIEPFSPKCPLRDPQTDLRLSYYIVIGRSKDLSAEHNQLRAAFGHNPEIITYDRFIQVAARIDASNSKFNNFSAHN